MSVDSAFATIGLVACQAGLGSAEGGLWMKNLAIGAAHGAASSDDLVERAAAVGVLSSAMLWCGLRARGREARVAGLTLAINDVINLVGQHAAARVYVSAHSRSAKLAEDAAAVAVARAAEAAAEAERTQQQGLLHATTVEVLQELAETGDEVQAGLIARREAARLRHVLRSRGRPQPHLDSALEKVAAQARDAGLPVELVTCELLADVDPVAIAALDEALLIVLMSAVELDHPTRAVVRATDEAGAVTVTARYQGEGFELGAGSERERRLAAVAPLLEAAGGSAEVWSAPGRGVRVSVALRIQPRAAGRPSAGRRAADEPPHALPDLRVGLAEAGDDDVASGDGDLGWGAAAGLVGAGEDHVGDKWVVDDVHADAPGESLEAGPQQGPPGDDAGRRTVLHDPRMTAGRPAVVVRTTSFPEEISGPRPDAHNSGDGNDEALRAGRTVIAGFLAYRAAGLATGMAAVAASRRRYRSATFAAVVLAAACAESIWMGRRLWRGGGTDAVATRIDALASLGAVAAVAASTAGRDRSTYLNWAPWGFAAPAVTGQAMTVAELSPDAFARAALVSASAAAALSAQPGELVTNMGAMAALFAGGRVLADQVRRGARRLEAARATAVKEGARLAAEQERARLLRVLHDSALQTLEAVGTGRFADLGTIRSRARQEAQRLQLELDGASTRPAPRGGASIVDEIERVVQVQTALGLQVNLSTGPVPQPSAAVAGALRDACNEALTNVRKHAGTSRALVRVDEQEEGVQITVQDDGRGFDPASQVGFGTSESIRRRLAEVGGHAEIRSEPGRGTQVLLWGPA